MFTIYHVLGTQTYTASHREAVEYYRQGSEIAVLVGNGSTWTQRALWVR